MNSKYFYIAFIALILANKVFACDDLLKADPSTYQVPEMANGLTTGVGGIVNFNVNYKDCTLDCRCVYNYTTKKWQVDVAPGQVCVFVKQCGFCKRTDKICQVRFVDLQSSSLYKKTFYADLPDKAKIQKCTREKGQPIQCEIISKLPNYESVKPIRD